MLNGYLIGVFGAVPELKSSLETSIAKKNEAEGITIYLRTESGTKYSFLDDGSFPEKIQGYAQIASISDHAFYIFPNAGKLSAADGELAVLIDSLGLPGTVEVIDSEASAFQDLLKSIFKDVSLSRFPLEQRSSKSSVISLSQIKERETWPKDRTLVYVDRAFNVKGVGLVVLGFALCGKVSVHDKLRLVPQSSGNKFAEVKGIQVNDEDQESVGRGIRVGLSLRGVELKDLEKVSWLDDGSFELSNSISFEFSQSKYYKQITVDRDVHLQANGELLVAHVSTAESQPAARVAKLQQEIPVWEGMPLCLIDLNAKPLRVMGGGRASAGKK
ncbi:MAG TPA: hypothetical protein VFF30_12670 [Nitrososphaerales archaeon]|nr:hypothetical protein [Nitrososphaerales archaeon]